MANNDNLALNNSANELASSAQGKGMDKAGDKPPATIDNGRLSRFVHDMKPIQHKPVAKTGNSEKPKSLKTESANKIPADQYKLQPLTPIEDTSLSAPSKDILQEQLPKEDSTKKQTPTPIVPLDREKWNNQAKKIDSDLDTPDLNNGLPKKFCFSKFNFKNVPNDQLPTIIFVMDYSVSMFKPDEDKRWRHVKPEERPRTIDYAEKTLETICSMLPDNVKVGIRVLGAYPLNKEKWELDCRCHGTELVVPPRKLRAPGDESVYQQYLKLRDRLKEKSLDRTPIPFALENAMKDLHDAHGKKMVVLISDGIPTCPDSEEIIKRMANDPDAKGVDTNLFGINLPKQKETELKATADKLHANFNNMPKEDLQGEIVNRVYMFMGAQVLPSHDQSHKVQHGSSELKWEEPLQP
jgi:hypothetical protein